MVLCVDNLVEVSVLVIATAPRGFVVLVYRQCCKPHVVLLIAKDVTSKPEQPASVPTSELALESIDECTA